MRIQSNRKWCEWVKQQEQEQYPRFVGPTKPSITQSLKPPITIYISSTHFHALSLLLFISHPFRPGPIALDFMDPSRDFINSVKRVVVKVPPCFHCFVIHKYYYNYYDCYLQHACILLSIGQRWFFICYGKDVTYFLDEKLGMVFVPYSLMVFFNVV